MKEVSPLAIIIVVILLVAAIATAYWCYLGPGNAAPIPVDNSTAPITTPGKNHPGFIPAHPHKGDHANSVQAPEQPSNTK